MFCTNVTKHTEYDCQQTHKIIVIAINIWIEILRWTKRNEFRWNCFPKRKIVAVDAIVQTCHNASDMRWTLLQGSWILWDHLSHQKTMSKLQKKNHDNNCLIKRGVCCSLHFRTTFCNWRRTFLQWGKTRLVLLHQRCTVFLIKLSSNTFAACLVALSSCDSRCRIFPVNEVYFWWVIVALVNLISQNDCITAHTQQLKVLLDLTA